MKSELASVAWAFSEHAAAVNRRLHARQMSASQEKLAATTDSIQAYMSPHFSDQGQANPRDARLSVAWAVDSANVDALSKLITFDGDAPRAELNRLLASTPAWFQAQYSTPEAFYAFLMTADALVSPPPREDVLEQAVPEDDGPGRVRFQPGRDCNAANSDGLETAYSHGRRHALCADCSDERRAAVRGRFGSLCSSMTSLKSSVVAALVAVAVTSFGLRWRAQHREREASRLRHENGQMLLQADRRLAAMDSAPKSVR